MKKGAFPKIIPETLGWRYFLFEAELKLAGLSTIRISIDGLPVTNDRIRRKQGAFSNAWNALAFFKEIGIRNRVVNTVVHRENVYELDAFSEFVFRSSATLWSIQIPLFVGRATEHDPIVLAQGEIRHLLEFAVRAARRFPIQFDEKCVTCQYLSACCGPCLARRNTDLICLREIWENEKLLEQGAGRRKRSG